MSEEYVLDITLNDGKYRIVAEKDMKDFRALCWGEEWRDLTGDNLIYFLSWELQEAREEIQRLKGN